MKQDRGPGRARGRAREGFSVKWDDQGGLTEVMFKQGPVKKAEYQATQLPRERGFQAEHTATCLRQERALGVQGKAKELVSGPAL